MGHKFLKHMLQEDYSSMCIDETQEQRKFY
jgi:hypothetical protein